MRWLAVPVGLWAVWAGLLAGLGGGGPTLVRVLALVVVGVACGAAGWTRGWPGGLAATAIAAALGCLFFFVGIRPSHDRAWSEDQARMPGVRIDGDAFTVSDLRAFRYRTPEDWDAAWREETYRFSELVGVDLGVEQFASLEAVAHTFVSFRFADGRVLVASVEIRKEQGEAFSPFLGLFRHYEKMIVLGDERDLVELRAVHREDTVYLIPLNIEREPIEAFLRSVLAETAALHDTPAFYNTLTASCSSTLAAHLREIAPVRWDYRMHLPGYTDALAHELGWVDGEGTLDEVRARFRIDDRAREAAGAADFSARIRR